MFAIYAVLFLWSQNLGPTNPPHVVIPIVVVVVIAAALTIVLGRLFRDIRRGAIVATPIVIGLLMYGHAARLVADLHVPVTAQQLGWVALVALAVIVAVLFGERRIATIDTLLNRVALILVLVTLVIIVPFQASAIAGRGSIPRVEPRSTTTTAPKRDVYWLVFDRYGSDRALRLQYGVENDLTPWLADHGYTVLADSHANYIRTVLSMSTTLQMSPLDEVARVQGSDSGDLTTVDERLQDPLVARQFKALGYRYYHIGAQWDPTRTDDGADVNLVSPTPPGTSEFTDALYDVSALPAIARRLHIAPESSRLRHWIYASFGLDALEGLRAEPGPKFVLAHILLPHPPLAFDRDGSYMDAADIKGLTADERYVRQLDYTNTRIKAILSGLETLPEAERPIVILQADEGPWPLSYDADYRQAVDWAAGATDDELEQKYGMLNAWSLPGGEDLGLYQSMTAINTFPVLFSRYFGIDYPLLPDRVYSSHDWFRPYDLTDITDRLGRAP